MGKISPMVRILYWTVLHWKLDPNKCGFCYRDGQACMARDPHIYPAWEWKTIEEFIDDEQNRPQC